MIGFFRSPSIDENPLGRDRMLCRGEFGAAVFEKRHSIRSRRARKAIFRIDIQLG